MITGMLRAEAAKIGINTQTYGVIGQYVEYQALAHAIETAGSLNATKMAAALDDTSSLATVVPGLSLDFTATPTVHNGYPLSYFTECTMQNGSVRPALRGQLTGPARDRTDERGVLLALPTRTLRSPVSVVRAGHHTRPRRPASPSRHPPRPPASGGTGVGKAGAARSARAWAGRGPRTGRVRK
jgi:hypothetical protein